MSSRIEARSLFFSYQGDLILEDVSFCVNRGETLAVVGPNGCGKSTLLHILSGLLPPTKGRVFVGEQETTGSPGAIGLMSQQDLLLPWKTLVKNLQLPLLLKGVPRLEAKERVFHALRRFHLEAFANHYPAQLSGGMRQKAALIRTSLTNSECLLLDEPLGALDALTRESLHDWLLEFMETYRTTAVLVTHDVREALYLADRLLFLSSLPARITKQSNIPFPHPRKTVLKYTKTFSSLEREVLSGLVHPGDLVNGKA